MYFCERTNNTELGIYFYSIKYKNVCTAAVYCTEVHERIPTTPQPTSATHKPALTIYILAFKHLHNATHTSISGTVGSPSAAGKMPVGYK